MSDYVFMWNREAVKYFHRSRVMMISYTSLLTETKTHNILCNNISKIYKPSFVYRVLQHAAAAVAMSYDTDR